MAKKKSRWQGDPRRVLRPISAEALTAVSGGNGVPGNYGGGSGGGGLASS